MNEILLLLETYGYLILFPLAVIEGPIITVAAGFLVTLGILNPLFVYLVVVAGDIVGDTLCWALGRWGGVYFIEKFGSYVGVTKAKVAQAKEYFATRHTKAVATAKLIHGIGFTGLIIAGSLHVPYRKFIQVCATITLGQSLVFLIIGLLFGRLYTVLSGYFNYYAAGISVLALTIIVITIYQNLRKAKP